MVNVIQNVKEMVYAELDENKVPEILKGKPRLAKCLAFTIASVTFVITAVMIGALVGYAFCYIEHRRMSKGHLPLTYSTTVQLINDLSLPKNKTLDNKNKTINGALMSSVIVTRIKSLGQKILEKKMTYVPWPNPVNAFIDTPADLV